MLTNAEWGQSSTHNWTYNLSDSVGVGLSVPTEKLDVNGDISANNFKADNNIVAVFDVSVPGKSRSLGFIPAGWYPTSVRVTPDGKHLLTGDHDNAVCLWDIETGKEIVRYKGCTKRIHSVAFCAQGQNVIASCGDMKTPIVNGRHEYVGCAVILWDLAGKELHRWDTHPAIVRYVAVCSAEPAALLVQNDAIKRVPLPK